MKNVVAAIALTIPAGVVRANPQSLSDAVTPAISREQIQSELSHARTQSVTEVPNAGGVRAELADLRTNFASNLSSAQEQFAATAARNFADTAKRELRDPPSRLEMVEGESRMISTGKVFVFSRPMELERKADFNAVVDNLERRPAQSFYRPSSSLSSGLSRELTQSSGSLEQARQILLKNLTDTSDPDGSLRQLLQTPIGEKEVSAFIMGVGGERLALFLDPADRREVIDSINLRASSYGKRGNDWQEELRHAVSSSSVPIEASSQITRLGQRVYDEALRDSHQRSDLQVPTLIEAGRNDLTRLDRAAQKIAAGPESSTRSGN